MIDYINHSLLIDLLVLNSQSRIWKKIRYSREKDK